MQPGSSWCATTSTRTSWACCTKLLSRTRPAAWPSGYGFNTPKHGSWLNVAEIELSALSRQCLDRRISTRQSLTRHTQAWCENRNRKQTGVDWQFMTEDARVKLKHLYPQYLS